MYAELFKINSAIAISGSTALFLQDKKTRNAHGDLDIFCWGSFQPLKGMVLLDQKTITDNYGDSDTIRESWQYGNLKIDVFFGEEGDVEILEVAGLVVVSCNDILKFKLGYLGSSTHEKHAADLIYYIQNNY